MFYLFIFTVDGRIKIPSSVIGSSGVQYLLEYEGHLE